MLKEKGEKIVAYGKTFGKQLLLALVIGCLGGLVGSLFHLSVDYVTELRAEHGWLLFLLPLGGLVIVFLYGLFKSKGPINTDRVLQAAGGEEKVPLVMVPLIFIGTVITHMLGGSAGREGAALQLGGGIGYNVGNVFRLKKREISIMVMAGMSSVFAALFGTPLTATVFSLEVVRVGRLSYSGLWPCLVASVTAFYISRLFGIAPVRFSVLAESFSLVGAGKVIVLALLCALVSILFCVSIHKCEHYMKKLIPNAYLRGACGGVIIIGLTLLLGTRAYNGAGMETIMQAMAGEAGWEAFLLKILFTAITVAAGFKGGEIVPAFFVGSTFGCVAGSLLGLEAGFGAAIGFVSLFCGAVNCPLASLLLAIEVFGTEGILLFALACAVSYMMSGHFGLYASQKILDSKMNGESLI